MTDFLTELEKYNRNHDPKTGRFSSGTGGGGEGGESFTLDGMRLASAAMGEHGNSREDAHSWLQGQLAATKDTGRKKLIQEALEWTGSNKRLDVKGGATTASLLGGSKAGAGPTGKGPVNSIPSLTRELSQGGSVYRIETGGITEHFLIRNGMPSVKIPARVWEKFSAQNQSRLGTPVDRVGTPAQRNHYYSVSIPVSKSDPSGDAMHTPRPLPNFKTRRQRAQEKAKELLDKEKKPVVAG